MHYADALGVFDMLYKLIRPESSIISQEV